MNIEHLRRKPDWLLHDAPEWAHNIWPRPQSLDWFIKSNRAALQAAGAIVKLGRAWLIDVERFPEVAREILTSRAAA